MKTVFFNSKNDPTQDLSFHSCGYEQCSPTFSFGPVIRDTYILHYIIQGQGYYVAHNGNKYLVKKGDIFAIFPNDLTYYYTDREDPWLFCWIIFNGAKAHDYYRQIGITHEHLIVHQTNDLFMKSIMNCLQYTAERKDMSSQLRLTSCILECLASIEDSNSISSHYKNSTKREYVNKALLFMDYYYGNGITVSDIAEHLGLERTYFYKIFKAVTNMTPEHYLMNVRIEKSKKLICLDVSFKNIAHAIGLKDVYYFTKLFKKIEGITPSEYRLQQKHKTETLR